MYFNARGAAVPESGAANGFPAAAVGGRPRLGSNRNDLFHSAPGDVMAGRLGDDRYHLWSPSFTVQESANEGIDTIWVNYWGDIVLPANVENVFLNSGGAAKATGNALGNLIVAGVAGARIDGRGGDDVLVGGIGADRFIISAGNGSDAIYGFKPGLDFVDLRGYAFTSFNQLRAASTQVGADLRIALSPTDTLLLRDVGLSSLTAADFGLPITFPTPPAGSSHLVNTANAVNRNGWYAYNNVWNADGLVAGRDYQVDGYFRAADMTGGTLFTWSFPTLSDAYRTVLAYPSVSYGFTPIAGPGHDPTDYARVFPVQVGQITDFVLDHDVSFGGSTSGFNIAYDIWLIDALNGGHSSISNEIMIWVHQGAVQPFGVPIGSYSDGAFTATVYHTGTYTALIANTDMPVGSLDFAAILDYLQRIGIVSPSEYVTSVHLGAEIASGGGYYTVNDFDFTVASREDGKIVVRDVTGSGATVAETSDWGLTGVVIEQLFDKHGTPAGDKVTGLDADGETNILFLDTDGALTRRDIVKTDATGAIVTLHHDPDDILLGSESALTRSNGTVTTTYFSAAGVRTGSQIHTVANDGDRMIQHVDASGSLVSVDMEVDNANGSTTIRHVDGDWMFLGQETVSTNAAGVGTTTVLDQFARPVHTIVDGTRGNDVLNGGSGSTLFFGALGSDRIACGSGADSIYFDTQIGGGHVDRILGFNSARDVFLLDREIFDVLPVGPLSDAAFGIGYARDASDRIIHDRTSGNIYFDPDGSGSAQAILFAKVDPGTVLQPADFIIL